MSRSRGCDSLMRTSFANYSCETLGRMLHAKERMDLTPV